MDDSYYAVVYLFGKNDNDQKEFVSKIEENKEVSAAIHLYQQINRVLNFYGVDGDEKFFGKISFSDSLDEAFNKVPSNYTTRKAFYHTTEFFIHEVVTEKINKKLFQLKRPLVIPYQSSVGTQSNHEYILQSFQYLQEIYSFSMNFGIVSTVNTWIPPFSFYTQQFRFSFELALQLWGTQLYDKLVSSGRSIYDKNDYEYIKKYAEIVTSLDFSYQNRTIMESKEIETEEKEEQVFNIVNDMLKNESSHASDEVIQLLTWKKSSKNE